jgi:Zn-dependent peptidase ImmA (M78 family)
VRESLGLAAEAALCPFEVANHLEIRVIGISEFENECPQATRYILSAVGRREISAGTFHICGDRVLVHNDAHHPKRQAANVAHEIAHALLHHPATGLLSDSGHRSFDPVLEEEANWLGPALLISEEAALWAADTNLSDVDASEIFGVSRPLMAMRMRVLKARERIAARRRKAA